MKHFIPIPKKTRFIIPFLCVILCTPLISAKVRTVDDARKIAESHLSSRNVSVGARLSDPASTRSGSDNYYAFDIAGDKGYVIVAADDRFQDILGYADKGNFSSALENPNLKFWLSILSSEMQTERKAEAKQKPTRAVNAVAVAPLLKTKWGQSQPFNNYCPRVYDYYYHEYVTAPTGCGATAMAQVLRYHQWPLSYTNAANETYQYKWDLMADTYDYEGSESEESIDQVASLMRHCGEAVNMEYGPDSSYSYVSDIENALISKFGYDASTFRHIERDYYGYEELHNLIYTELSEKRPILTRGDYAGEDGHIFVLDGSTGDGFFHFNWGWNGYCDGYYRLTSLRPADFGTGGSYEGYSFNVTFSLGIQPARSEATEPQQKELSANGDLSLFSDAYRGEMNYSEKMSLFANTENGSYSGFTNTGTATLNTGSDPETCIRFHTVLTNLDNGEETLSERYMTLRGTLPPSYYFSGGLEIIADNLADNTRYKASVVFKDGNDDTLYPIRFSLGCRSYIIIERKGDKVYVSEPSAESAIKGDMPADLDRIVRSGNKSQTFNIKISNPGDTEYLGQVKWRYTTPDGYTDDWLNDYAMVNILPGDEEEVEFTLYNLKRVNPGTYTVGLYDFRNRLIGETCTVEIADLTVSVDEATFPDPVLRDLIATSYDNDGNGVLSEKELSEVYSLSFNGYPISDFTGLENFFDTYSLYISNSDVQEIKIPSGTSIMYLTIRESPIENLILGDLPSLTSFELTNSNAGKLDLSGFDKLESIDVDNNKLESLILPKSDNLESLYCQNNLLKELDLSGLTNIDLLYFSGNQISEIDLSRFKNLQYFSCNNNPVGKLDLSGNNKLTYAYMDQCGIKDLILSPSYPLLTTLSAAGNSIEGSLDLSGCPSLASIDFYSNNLSGIKLCEMPDLTFINLSNNSISGKIDLSASDGLTMIYLSNNDLSEIALGHTAGLKYFDISCNNISGVLDLTEAENLISVSAFKNQLKGMVLGYHPELKELYIQTNQIEGTLDISGAPSLMHLFASENEISELKYAEHPDLMSLDLSINALTHFHLETLPQLSYRSVGSQKLSATISSANFDLSTLIAKGFDPDRASNWRVSRKDGNNRLMYNCEVSNGEVVIPEMAGGEFDLTYTYLTHKEYNYPTDYTFKVTREGYNSVDDLIAEGAVTVNGNSIIFGGGINGEIFTTGGVNVFKGTGETPALPSGIYIVRVASSVTKIAIP